MKRTHHCGELRIEQVGQEVVVMGWAQTMRDHGGLIFIDIRDRSGLVQTVFNPETQPEAHQVAGEVHCEYVLAIRGQLRRRPTGTENTNLPTGDVEIVVEAVEILNRSKTPPFPISDEEADESLRLKHRYLDLRRPRMRHMLELRHRIVKAVRDQLDSEGFWEVETPMLWKSTPEGAREYVVPSRLSPGKFFVLPQSPQLCKQMLMVSGVEKYFQIARCFRDEDTRADRQPEFTQIDIEMSFVDQDDVLSLMERMFAYVMKNILGQEITIPFKRMTYAEAMRRFGCDKPDIRFGMELKDLTDIAAACNFKVFREIADKGGQVKAITAPGCAAYSRKEVADLAEIAAQFGAKGLATFAVGESEIKSQIAKFFTEDELKAVFERAEAKAGDLVLIVADKAEVVAESLHRLRMELGKRLKLIPESGFSFHWVTDFPMFGWNEKENRYDPMHHPFCMPYAEDMSLMDEGVTTAITPGHPDHPWGRVRASLYDLVLNGYEVAGGSIRTHRRDIQEKVFNAIGLSMEEAYRRFGFVLEAFEYGAPPHGGIAAGLDRFIAILMGQESIREVIAFPKTASATCPLSGAPTEVSPAVLEELHIQTVMFET